MKFLLAIAAAICLSADTFAQSDSIMFPACFQKNVFNICEGFPGLLGFYPISEPESKTGVLRLEIPAFLEFRRSSFTPRRIEDPFTKKTITRDGIPYTRIEIQLSDAFRQHWATFKNSGSFPFYLKQVIVLDSVKASAGKSARIYWTLITDRGASAEKSMSVKILPSIKMPTAPTKYFTVGVSDIETPSGTYDDYAKRVCAFWKGLSSAEIFGNLSYGEPIPDPQFASSKESGSVCFFPNFRPDPLENDIRKGKLNHRYPTCADHHNHYGLALAYMVDDPDGMFAKYLKDGILRFKDAAPKAKYLLWDYEPLAKQYSNYDLEVFSRRYMKLDKTLTYPEIEKKYPRQWSNFCYEQSAQLVQKYTDSVRRYWPEVKIMMVSGFLERQHPETNYRSAFTPLDLRDTERYFDVHSPMLYWQGTSFYDDVEFNLRYLKKPFIPWIDPTEHRDVFYQRYTPQGVCQNILACAALGAKGIVFYPVGGLDGAYYQAIADAYDQIAKAEDALSGEDITAKCSVHAANVIEMKLSDVSGRESAVLTPEVEPNIRWRVYRKGSNYAVALFNYNPEKVILRLMVPGFAKDALVKLEPMDAVILTRLPDSEKIRPELEKMLLQLRQNTQLKSLKYGGSTVAWRALDRKAHPALISGRCTFTINPEKGVPSAWACPYPSWDPLINPKKDRGHLGKIFLMDNGKPVELNFNLVKFMIDEKRPSLLLEHIQKPFGGFQELENEFEGLHISAQWILAISGKQAILKCTATNHSPRKKMFPLVLKIQSYPRIGYKFGPQIAPGILNVDGQSVAHESEGNFVLVKKGKRSGMNAVHIPEREWKHPEQPVTISSETPKFHEELRLTPDPKTAAFYNWFSKGEGMTAEFLTEEVNLKPGEAVTYEFVFDYAMEEKARLQRSITGVWGGRLEYDIKLANMGKKTNISVTPARLPDAGGNPEKIDWSKAVPTSTWKRTQDGTDVNPQSQMLLAVDSKYLYLKYTERNPPKGDGSSFWNDCVELYFSELPMFPVLQIAISPNGEKKELIHKIENDVVRMEKYDFNAKFVSHTASNSWEWMLAIPLERLPLNKGKIAMTANFFRTYPGKDARLRVSWSPIFSLDYRNGISRYGRIYLPLIEYQDASFTLGRSTQPMATVQDPNASDGKAAIVDGNKGWTLTCSLGAVEKALYNVKAYIRTDAVLEEGLTTRFGIYDPVGKKIAGMQQIPVKDISGNEFKEITFGPVTLSPDMYFYIGGFNKKVSGKNTVYVDRFILEKVTSK